MKSWNQPLIATTTVIPERIRVRESIDGLVIELLEPYRKTVSDRELTIPVRRVEQFIAVVLSFGFIIGVGLLFARSLSFSQVGAFIFLGVAISAFIWLSWRSEDQPSDFTLYFPNSFTPGQSLMFGQSKRNVIVHRIAIHQHQVLIEGKRFPLHEITKVWIDSDGIRVGTNKIQLKNRTMVEYIFLKTVIELAAASYSKRSSDASDAEDALRKLLRSAKKTQPHQQKG